MWVIYAGIFPYKQEYCKDPHRCTKRWRFFYAMPVIWSWVNLATEMTVNSGRERERVNFPPLKKKEKRKWYPIPIPTVICCEFTKQRTGGS